MAIKLSNFEQQIRKTGFALEHNIVTALREKSWGVISNKYYIDDQEETVREIDLIASLMKAQAYEVRALPSRKIEPFVYHFSLLSVVDTALIRIVFEDDKISAEEIQSEQYLANYIIGKKQDVSRIRFLQLSVFRDAIADYDELHSFNCRVFSNC